MVSAIILSGGIGKRMEQPVPKQFLNLGGKPIILHVIEKLDAIQAVDEIVIVCHKDFLTLVESYMQSYRVKTPYKIVAGGDTRQSSTYIGLMNARYDCVLIHEAARPFVRKEEFEYLISSDFPNATFGISIPFTVLKGRDTIEGILDRKELFNVQLPQKFDRKLLLEAHQKAKADKREFTEDASLLFHYTGASIKILKGSVYNIKITDPVDMITGEIIYKDYILGRE